ncbi:hypothetical protein OG21DRAFT_1486625 [Imleria badia]|nr:hypothetical protein OG21DRAFT_1486625 [Imleria badia]
MNWPTDVDVHKIMEAAEIIPIKDPEENEFFGEHNIHRVFQDCVPVLPDVDWNYTSYKLPGIPIMVALEEPECDLPDGRETQENSRYKESILPETTNIPQTGLRNVHLSEGLSGFIQLNRQEHIIERRKLLWKHFSRWPVLHELCAMLMLPLDVFPHSPTLPGCREDDLHPADPDAVTAPLMYQAGTYFICDVVADSRIPFYCIPYSKTFNSQYILHAYNKGMSRSSKLPEYSPYGPRQQPFILSDQIGPSFQTPLPVLSPSVNHVPLLEPPHPHGPNVNYFHYHGGGNCQPAIDDDEPHLQEDPCNPLKIEVHVILKQMFFYIVQEFLNKKSQLEGAWINIPQALRHEFAVEDLYLTLNLSFHSVQYTIASIDQ